MLSDRAYKVRWLVAPDDPESAGVYGTTTHSAHSPASAALTSAEYVALAISKENIDGAFHVISVTGEDDGANLLSADQLRAELRFYPKELSLDVVYRPLC